MARYRYLRHDDPAPPLKRSVSTRLTACGYPTTRAAWGENIAFGLETPAAVMRAWLRSRGHRRNIESRRYSAIGVVAATSESRLVYWAQDFGSYGAHPRAPSSAVGVLDHGDLPLRLRERHVAGANARAQVILDSVDLVGTRP